MMEVVRFIYYVVHSFLETLKDEINLAKSHTLNAKSTHSLLAREEILLVFSMSFLFCFIIFHHIMFKGEGFILQEKTVVYGLLLLL